MSVEVFYSYAPADDGLRQQLEKHLAALRRQHLITDWHPQKIGAGVEVRAEEMAHLERARIILLLISADFIASDYCHEVEIKRAMERLEQREAEVIPVLLRPVDFTGMPFAKLRALPGEPVTSDRWSSTDAAFRAVADGIREVVERIAPRAVAGVAVAATAEGTLRLLPPPPPLALPDRPYPLLEPYEHPATFTGRQDEVKETLRELRSPRLLLAIHAASGAGKSSFLQAGLLPALRELGHPVALDRRPDEPGIARRLVADLVDLPDDMEVPDGDPQGFARLLKKIGDLAPRRPILVLDQLEDAIRRDEAGAPLARLGPLLAATAAHPLPQGQGFVCRWILVYRQEFHGALEQWLENVLREARSHGVSGLDGLPPDLHRPDYYQKRVLAPLGDPGAADDPLERATEIFLRAIEVPLSLSGDDGAPRYPWAFADGEARRLAEAFASARLRRPRAPLSPELQVVLAHLLEAAPRAPPGERRTVAVPEDPGALIAEALRAHLRRKLDEAFAKDGAVVAKTRRTQALFALRELADEQGQRGAGLAVRTLTANLGADAELLLSRLERPDVRLLLREWNDADLEQHYVLPHDSLAAVVVALFEDPVARATYELDEQLVELRRTVSLLLELHRHGNAAGTALAEELYARVEAARDKLAWDDERRGWWKACEEVRRARIEAREREEAAERAARARRRRIAGWTTAAVAAVAVAVAGVYYKRYFPERYLTEITTAKNHADAAQAYDHLMKYPGHGAAARAAMATFLVGRSRLRAVRGELDEALLLGLEADALLGVPVDRAETAYLLSRYPEDMIFLNHEDYVMGGKVFAEQKRILTWTTRAAYLWDSTTGQRVAEPLQHSGIDDASLSADAGSVLTLNRMSGAYLWTISGNFVTKRQLALGRVEAAALDTNARHVLVVSGAGSRVLRTDTGSWSDLRIEGLTWVAPGFDTGRFVALGNKGDVLTIDVEAGKSHHVPTGLSLVERASMSPDRSTALLEDGKRAALWDVRSWQPVVAPFDVKPGEHLAPVSNDRVGIVGDADEAVVRSVRSGATYKPLLPPHGTVMALSATPEGEVSALLKIGAMRVAFGRVPADDRPAPTEIARATILSEGGRVPSGGHLLATTFDEKARRLDMQVWDVFTSSRVGQAVREDFTKNIRAIEALLHNLGATDSEPERKNQPVRDPRGDVIRRIERVETVSRAAIDDADPWFARCIHDAMNDARRRTNDELLDARRLFGSCLRDVMDARELASMPGAIFRGGWSNGFAARGGRLMRLRHGLLTIYDVNNGGVMTTDVSRGSGYERILVDPGGETLATVADHGQVSLWRTTDGSRVFDDISDATIVGFSPRGGELAVVINSANVNEIRWYGGVSGKRRLANKWAGPEGPETSNMVLDFGAQGLAFFLETGQSGNEIVAEGGRLLCSEGALSSADKVIGVPETAYLMMLEDQPQRVVLSDARSGCAPLGDAVALDGQIVQAAASADGKLAVVTTDRLVHFFRITPAGLHPLATRFLRRQPTEAQRFADGSGRKLDVVVRRGTSMSFETVSLDLAPSPLKGTADERLALWQERLGMKIDEYGTITPRTSEAPSAATVTKVITLDGGVIEEPADVDHPKAPSPPPR